MEKGKEEKIQSDEEIKATEKAVELLREHSVAVEGVIDFVLKKSVFTPKDLENANTHAKEILEDLSSKTVYIGEIIMGTALAYLEIICTMINILSSSLPNNEEVTLDSIAKERFKRVLFGTRIN